VHSDFPNALYNYNTDLSVEKSDDYSNKQHDLISLTHSSYIFKFRSVGPSFVNN
jgi:hypothetical protein